MDRLRRFLEGQEGNGLTGSGENSSRGATWFFDYVSPYAYLQAELLARRQSPVAIHPCPVLFAGILNHWGQLGPAEIPPKRRFTYQHVRWLARRHGIPLRFPGAHPFNPLALLRATLVAGPDWDNVRRTFRFVWAEGRLPEGADLESLLTELAATADALEKPAIKDQLRENTDQAIALGVFGVPSLALGEQLFWGVDATDMFLDALRHPELYRDDEARRLDELPTGARRR
ncbi:MAG: 2-hydroxychromene-2-carboxylate isomerase [Xanthomonadales bacterium]|nr:2-hydroxychromene-2-carboxylate isomerase [Xanthomonadales bacterium]